MTLPAHLIPIAVRPTSVQQEPQGEDKHPFVSREQAGGSQPDAGTQAPATPTPPSPLDPAQCQSTLPWILAMVAIMYFLLIRPQQKQEKQRKAMLAAIKEGDRVVTSGGVHGTVSSIGEDTVSLRVDPKTKITVDRSAIGRIVDGEKAKKEPAAGNGT
jgi:preprotein translocase subunit YajC